MSVACQILLGSAAEDTDFWLCLFQHRHCFGLWREGLEGTLIATEQYQSPQVMATVFASNLAYNKK